MSLLIKCPVRGGDPHGSGHWGAKRGSRKHKGIDYAAPVGGVLLSPVAGTVTKFGHPYADDLSYEYVEITDAGNTKHRFFYVEPLVQLNATVDVLEEIGLVQDLTTRYEKITNHVHYEIKRGNTHVKPI